MKYSNAIEELNVDEIDLCHGGVTASGEVAGMAALAAGAAVVTIEVPPAAAACATTAAVLGVIAGGLAAIGQ